MANQKSITIHCDTPEIKRALYNLFYQGKDTISKFVRDQLKDMDKIDSEPELIISEKTNTIKVARFTRDKGWVIALNKDKEPVYQKYTDVGNNEPFIIFVEGQLGLFFKRSNKADERAGSFANLDFVRSQDWSLIPDPAIQREKREAEQKKKQEEAEKRVAEAKALSDAADKPAEMKVNTDPGQNDVLEQATEDSKS